MLTNQLLTLRMSFVLKAAKFTRFRPARFLSSVPETRDKVAENSALIERAPQARSL